MTKALMILSAVVVMSLTLGGCGIDDHSHASGSLVGQDCEFRSVESAIGTVAL